VVSRLLLAVLLIAVAARGVAAQDPLPVIDECIAKLDASVDVGYARIAERCPQLTAALSQAPYASWLPADWKRPDNQLSAQGLSELRVLLARAADAHPLRAAAPDTRHVAAVLQVLALQEQAHVSWWSRFKEWLRQIMSLPSQPNESWLARWLRGFSLSRNAMDIIIWGCLALAVLLALGVIVNELRVAGRLGARTRRSRLNVAAAPGGSDLTLAQVEAAAPREQPGLMLELIAAHLAARDLLPPARTLTARELTRRARLPERGGRTHLAELVAVCERIRFADQEVEEDTRLGALQGARRLLETIDALPAVAVPA
jgi:hypothetical protein